MSQGNITVFLIYQLKSLEPRTAGAYFLALLTRSRKGLDANGTTKGMPRSQIVLCTKPHTQLAIQCILVSVPGTFRRGVATPPPYVFSQVGIRCSRWERRVIIKRWEREEEYIQRSLVNLGVSQMLLQSLFAGKGSIASLAVEGRSMCGRVSRMLL